MENQLEKIEEKTMTVKELAEFLGKHEQTIRIYAKQNDIKLIKGHDYYFNKLEVGLIIKKMFVNKKIPIAFMNPFDTFFHNKKSKIPIINESCYENKDISNKELLASILDNNQKMIEIIVKGMTKNNDKMIEVIKMFVQNPIQQKNTKETVKEVIHVPEKTVRSELVQLVRKHDDPLDRSKNWTFLYNEYMYRFHTNLWASARNNEMSVLDYAEESGQINNLLALAKEVLPNLEN